MRHETAKEHHPTRPDKLEDVKEALTQLNVSGMTITEVRGHGRAEGPQSRLSRNGVQRHPSPESHARIGRPG